jgi:hypothetical protein
MTIEQKKLEDSEKEGLMTQPQPQAEGLEDPGELWVQVHHQRPDSEF